MTNRERYIAIGVAAVAGIWALDAFLVEPLLARQTAADTALANANKDLEDAATLAKRRLAVSKKWGELAGSSLKNNLPEAEGQLLNFVRDEAAVNGLNLESLKPERADKDGDFQQLSYRAVVTGSLAQQTQFLNAIRTAKIPVRIVDFQLSSRKDSTDDLSLQAGLATIYLPPADAGKADPSRPVAANKTEAPK